MAYIGAGRARTPYAVCAVSAFSAAECLLGCAGSCFTLSFVCLRLCLAAWPWGSELSPNSQGDQVSETYSSEVSKDKLCLV